MVRRVETTTHENFTGVRLLHKLDFLDLESVCFFLLVVFLGVFVVCSKVSSRQSRDVFCREDGTEVSGVFIIVTDVVDELHSFCSLFVYYTYSLLSVTFTKLRYL